MIHTRYSKKPKEGLRFPDRIVDYRTAPVVVDNTLEYEVVAILKQRVRKYGKGFRKTYLVHWKGYPSEDDSWEPGSKLKNSEELLKEFLASEQKDVALDVHSVKCLQKHAVVQPENPVV